MKQFQFPLEKARRWREAQFALQRAQLAAAAAEVIRIQSELDGIAETLREGAGGLREASVGEEFESWATFKRLADQKSLAVRARLAESRRVLSAGLTEATEAKRRLQLLEDLKKDAIARWKRDFDRELDSFAGEAHLARLTRR